MYNHDGKFHKDFILMGHNDIIHFSCRRQRMSKEEILGVDLPNLATKWLSLSMDNIIQPTWNESTFLCSSTAASASIHILASHISTGNLKAPCP